MSKVSINIETIAHNIAQVATSHYLSGREDIFKFKDHKDFESLPADLEWILDVYTSTYEATYKILKDREELENYEAMKNRGF